MPTVPQIFLGVAIGLLGAFYVLLSSNRRHAIGHGKNSSYFEDPENSVCMICQEEMVNDDIQYLSCGHALHSVCWNECKRRRMADKCPLCRKDL
ncbi:RING finger protein 32-like [Glossina fuscipes]|uniref:RING finger protein 32-like n=1 Tax=Glossina fuscipes TaxID=7396 RepID=A0A9C6DPJ1_9MUSC|nr:RING finger protein 32-like [Glossina fuscipes]